MRVLVVLCLVAAAACGTKPVPTPPPTPGPLQAGVATVPLDVPIGVSMGGYGRKRPAGELGSPFAEKLPASTGVHTLPTARAVALSDGVTKVVIVRLDACLTTASLRWEAAAVLKERGYDATLIVSSTHTHAGPARYFRPAPAEGSGGIDPTTLAMDTFDAEIEQRMGRSIADAAGKALDSMVPASVNASSFEAGQFNNDRRCENDDLYGPGFRDTVVTIVRLDAVDGAGAPTHPLTGFIHFAMHGTVLGDDNDLLSSEVPGAMELWASDAVGVPLVYLQGSAGDVSPNTGALGFGDFQALEWLGRVSAPLIAEAFAKAAPGPAPATARLVRHERPVDITAAAIGYAHGEFPQYGGIACGLGAANCPPVASTPEEMICLPLKKRPYSQTQVVALQLGDIAFGTMPGEPTTAIGVRTKALFDGVEGVKHRLVLGYAQDHFGYILEAPDYLRLGYEPTVSAWGFKFGDFIVGELSGAVKALGQKELAPLVPERSPRAAREPTISLVAPAVVGLVPGLERLGVATFQFHGGDPALGTPEVFLEREEGGGFVTAMASATRKVSVGPDVVLRWAATPTTKDDPAATRRDHLWTAEWETVPDTAVGTWRFVARGSAKSETGTAAYEVKSAPFTVAKAKSAGAKASATVDAAGVLALKVRWPANPSTRALSGAVTGHYRARDLVSNPAEGALVSGGAVTASVTSPDATTATVTLTWSAAASAYVGTVKALAGTTAVHVAADGVVDGAQNTNGAALDTTATR